MTGLRCLDPGADIVVGHAIEIVVGFVIGFHVIHTEPVVLAFRVAPLWRPVVADRVTVRPLASECLRFGLAAFRLDADPVKIFRIQFHLSPGLVVRQVSWLPEQRASITRFGGHLEFT